jgi:HSP20 family protein
MAEKQAMAVATREPRPPTVFEQMEHEFTDLRRRMTDLFRRPFAPVSEPSLLGEINWTPRVDAYEVDGTLQIKAELPGVKQDDVGVMLQDGILTIAGKRSEEKEVKDARYYAAERFSGSFSRSFSLPDGVDAGAIAAEFKDGVLDVRIPLPATAKAEAVTIPVKS